MARNINTLLCYISTLLFIVVTLSRMRFDGLSLLLLIIAGITYYIDSKAERALRNH